MKYFLVSGLTPALLRKLVSASNDVPGIEVRKLMNKDAQEEAVLVVSSEKLEAIIRNHVSAIGGKLKIQEYEVIH